MNRHYYAEEVGEFFHRVHCHLPHVRIHTHILVGFPGESDKDFQCTLDFLDQHPYVWFSAYPFSPVPGTTAALLSGDIPRADVDSRMAQLPQERCL